MLGLLLPLLSPDSVLLLTANLKLFSHPNINGHKRIGSPLKCVACSLPL